MEDHGGSRRTDPPVTCLEKQAEKRNPSNGITRLKQLEQRESTSGPKQGLEAARRVESRGISDCKGRKIFEATCSPEPQQSGEISALRCTDKKPAPEHADRMREREEEEAPHLRVLIVKQCTEKVEECGPEVTEPIRGVLRLENRRDPEDNERKPSRKEG